MCDNIWPEIKCIFKASNNICHKAEDILRACSSGTELEA